MSGGIFHSKFLLADFIIIDSLISCQMFNVFLHMNLTRNFTLGEDGHVVAAGLLPGSLH